MLFCRSCSYSQKGERQAPGFPMKTQCLPGWGIEKVENEACVKIKSRVPTSPSCPTCSLRRKIAVGGAEQLPKYAQYFLSSESENPSELHSYLGALRKSRYRVNRQEDEAWPETKHPGTALVGYRVGCHSGPLDCPLCGLQSEDSLGFFFWKCHCRLVGSSGDGHCHQVSVRARLGGEQEAAATLARLRLGNHQRSLSDTVSIDYGFGLGRRLQAR